MRRSHWVLGLVLGAIAGGSALVAGVLAILLFVFTLVWAARETERPAGLGGLLVGFGIGVGGLFALADARCAAFGTAADGVAQGCSSPDATPFLIATLVMVAAGALVTLVGIRNTSRAGR